MNFTSQICTTEEQSELLLDLGLKAETADMSYRIHYFDLDGILLECIHTLEPHPPLNNDRFIPAWSLHRLIELCAISKVPFIRVKFQNTYDEIISLIAETIKFGAFNKKYLEE